MPPESASPRPHVLVVGSTMMDLVAYVARAPGPGETVVGTRFAQGFGGKGANQAVMAALLGAEVALVACVGQDAYGAQTIAHLEDVGVGVAGVRRVPGASGIAPIWVEADGTNRIIVVPGANDSLDGDHAAAAVAGADAVEVVVGQLEVPQAATAAAFTAARRRGATTILNPAPFAPLQDDLLAVTDWLVPNEVELAAMVGRPCRSDEDLLAGAGPLAPRLLVTLGPDGAALVDGATVHRVAAPEVRVVDTTGAGDAFIGAFAVALASGRPPLESIGVGVRVASDSVTRPGTQASFPDREAAAALAASPPQVQPG